MPWTLDGVYVDANGNPVYPDDTAYGGAAPTIVDPFTPPSAMPAASPVVGGEPLPEPGAVPPEVQPHVPQPAPQITGSSQSQSGSQSYSRTNTPQAARDQFRQGFAGDNAYLDAQGEAQIAADRAQSDQAYGDIQAARATPEQLAGAPSLLQAQMDQFDATARGSAAMADMYRNFAIEEKAAHEAGEAMVTQASLAYQSQVKQFQAMKVNPGQLWGNMSGGQRAGTFASVFIADFLGAKGVHTSVHDTINMAIDRNINAQIENINNQGKTAGMFKDLYNMAVAESATDEEMRTRLRGFHLAQMQADVASELARYDAPLAQATMAEAIALTNQMQQENNLQHAAQVRARVDGLKRMYSDQRQAELRASVEMVAIRTAAATAKSQREHEAELAAPKAVAIEPPTRLIKNPFDGRPMGKAVNDEAWKRFTTSAEGAADMVTALDTYERVKAEAGAIYQGPYNKQLMSEADSKVKAARELVFKKYVLAMTGKAATVVEAKDLGYVIPEDTWWSRSNRDQVLGQFGGAITSKWQQDFNQYGVPLNAQEQAAADSGAFDSPPLADVPGLQVKYDTAANPEAPVNTFADDKLAGAANERWTSASRIKAAREAAESVSGRSPKEIAEAILKLDAIAYGMVDESGTGIEDSNQIQAIRATLAKEYEDVTGTPPPAPKTLAPGDEGTPTKASGNSSFTPAFE